jgi:hypothetical protein
VTAKQGTAWGRCPLAWVVGIVVQTLEAQSVAWSTAFLTILLWPQRRKSARMLYVERAARKNNEM